MTAAFRSSDIAIDVKGLSKSFGGREVVHDLSMQVKRGTIYGFLGPNGSGKTTTIRMLCGLLTPDSGEGTCLGYDIRRDADKIKRQVGYMTQRFSLYQDLSVRENLEFVARLYGVRDARGTARDMIKRLGLTGREEQLAGELSGGWKQRLALGACTLPNPQLLLLDEPTAGVDPKARRDFWNEIHALAAARADGAGLDPLHGRGRALPRDRLYRLWPSAGARHRGRGDREIGADDLHRDRRRPQRARRPNSPASPASTWWRRSAPACTCPAATGPRWRPPSRPVASDRGWHWQHSEPSLEDVFIELMTRSKDNFQ